MSGGRVVCLVGPTASGKSTVAMAVAEIAPIEIVSADSRQVVRGLDVGTAKPTAAERARVPHHGLDEIEPGEQYDAARFATRARAAIGEIHGRGRHALVVGGTGLYLRALTRGLAPAPPRSPPLRVVLTTMARASGPAELHRWLATIDPPIAARVDRNDAVRILRALEVAFVSGRRLSDWHADARDPAPWPMPTVGLSVPTAALDVRIEDRVRRMLADGWIEEIRRLVTEIPPDAPAWRTVGYRELRAYVEGTATLDQAHSAIALATRRYAKRQRTWFRREPDIEWVDALDLQRAVDLVVTRLQG